MNHDLRTALLRMRDDDERTREELARDGSLFDGYHPRMAEVHHRNAVRLEEILVTFGWPDAALVGNEAAEAAWLIAQHAITDPPIMRLALARLHDSVHAGRSDPTWLAYLTDRIRVLEGQPQRYGTSHDWDASGQLSPDPIEDAEHVDERRRAVGLGPLADRTRELREQAAREGEKPPQDPAARRREKDAWASAAGWR